MSPYASPHPCSAPGCRTLVPSGQGSRCPAHLQAFRAVQDRGRKADPVRQASIIGLYGSAEWKRLRAEVLGEQGICVVVGCGERATELDHVRSLRDGGPALERANVQGLCRRHHAAKGTRAGERYGRRP